MTNLVTNVVLNPQFARLIVLPSSRYSSTVSPNQLTQENYSGTPNYSRELQKQMAGCRVLQHGPDLHHRTGLQLYFEMIGRLRTLAIPSLCR